jgi:predicted nucleic acid-binding protein
MDDLAQAIADSSPLILYARTGQIDVLQQLIQEVWVPPAVSNESFRLVPDRPGAAVLAGLSGTWLREVPLAAPPQAILSSLHPGEAEAITLATEHGLPLLIDERIGRRIARQLGLAIVGSAGLLLLGKERGIVDAVAPRLDALIAAGLRLAPSVYQQVLERAGEQQEDGGVV